MFAKNADFHSYGTRNRDTVHMTTCRLNLYLNIVFVFQNLFAIVKMHNKQFIKITFHLAGQTGDSYALMSARKN